MSENKGSKTSFAKLAHIGGVVKDIDKAIKRLETLGIGPFEPHTTPPTLSKPVFRGKPADSEEKVFRTRIGNIGLVLFESVKGASPWKEFLDSKGEGIQHIAFAVDNLDKEMAQLQKQGLSSIGGVKWEGGGGGFYFDPEIGNVLLELFKD